MNNYPDERNASVIFLVILIIILKATSWELETADQTSPCQTPSGLALYHLQQRRPTWQQLGPDL